MTLDVTHKLFVDDSGNKDYAPDGRYNARGGRTPYFVFGGVLLSPSEAGALNLELRMLKIATFGTYEVEIKSHWLRRPEQKKKRYLDRFGITEADLTNFTDSVYDMVNDLDCQLVACTVNKAEVARQYRNPHHPASIAYDCLLQRVQWEMAACDGCAHVTVDTMTGATPAGNQHLRLLTKQHNTLKKHGSPLRANMRFDRIGGLVFRDSALDERLQVADLVAYSVYRQFIDHGPDWEDPSKSLELYEYLGRVIQKFRHNRGRVQGYGIVKFPRNNTVKWGFQPKK